MSDSITFTQEHISEMGGDDQAYWLFLHYEVLYAKVIYYNGVALGFTPMVDEDYDLMEAEYKSISSKLGKKPTAALMVGCKVDPIVEALAYRNYDEARYESIKNGMFKFKE